MTWISSLIQPIIISIFIIGLVHYFILYLRDTYTTKKTKDIVGYHIQKYKSILDELHEKEKKQWEKRKLELSSQELEIVDNDLANFIQDLIK